MEPVDRILKNIDKNKLVYNDLHILRFYSSMVIVSGGKVIEVFKPTLKYCPLANSLYKNFRILDKVKVNPLLFKKAVCDAVEEKISQFGFFTENRKIYQKEISIPYGASEILMYALRKGRIEAAVTVCDGAGTVIASNPEIVQGIGARMNGLFYTTPFHAVVERLERNNCAVIPAGLIDQIEGVKMAIRLGYRNIAVTVNGYSGANLREIRELERVHNVSIVILVVCTTGIGKRRISEIKQHADLVWSCGSGYIRSIIGQDAILQMSVIIPVFVLTTKGMTLAASYCSGCAEMNTIDVERQYVISQIPKGREIIVGNFKAYLHETKLPVRSKKEPF
jgi:putative methanogenesis marker protein 8